MQNSRQGPGPKDFQYTPGVLSVLPLIYVGWSDSVLSPSEMKRIHDEIAELDYLTKKEKEVLTLIAEGFEQQEIAAQLHISRNTVATHISHIYKKLEVPNAPAAINKAHKLGLFH